MRRGFIYLVAVIDWYSRKVLSWRISNTPVSYTHLDVYKRQVNTLLETVQTGLLETCDVLAELSAGHLSARGEGMYQGACAELKDGTNMLADEFESTLARLAETVSAVRSATSEILDGVTDLAERTSDCLLYTSRCV